jgi:hypothetical protein
MAARAGDALGPPTKEVASEFRTFALDTAQQATGTLPMNPLSILAMALVIYLFGGYVDSRNEQRLASHSGPPSQLPTSKDS